MSETETARESIADDIAFLYDLTEGYVPVEYEAALDRVVERIQHLTQALEEIAYSLEAQGGGNPAGDPLRYAMVQVIARALTPTTPDDADDIEAAERDLAEGNTRSSEDVFAELSDSTSPTSPGTEGT